MLLISLNAWDLLKDPLKDPQTPHCEPLLWVISSLSRQFLIDSSLSLIFHFYLCAFWFVLGQQPNVHPRTGPLGFMQLNQIDDLSCFKAFAQRYG